MKFYRICSFPLFLYLVSLFVSAGCSGIGSGSSASFALVDASDPPWVRHFKRTIGKHWYEVRFSGVRVGRASSERSVKIRNGQPVYHFSHDEQLRLQILGTTNNISREEEKYYSATFPYSLLNYSFMEKFDGGQFRLEVARISPGKYKMKGVMDAEEHVEVMSGNYYSLEDELDLEMWLQADPEIGETESFHSLNLGMSRLGMIDATVKNITNLSGDSEENRVYEILTTPEDGVASHFKYDDKGEMIYKSAGGRFTYYRQSFKPTLPADDSVDIYVNNIVPIHQKIGRSAEVQSLELLITGPHVNLLESSSGQAVACNEEDGSCSVRIFSDDVPVRARNTVSENDTKEYLQATSRILSDTDTVKNLAKEIVGETLDQGKQVEKLVEYIDAFLMPGYVFRTNLNDLLKDRKGDCTEYALLFVALARSLGIPSREVSGLVYMGDWCQGFGLHAWNEVYLNGRWTGVDASHNSSKIQPVYIRFPDDAYKNILLIEATHEMDIEIKKVIQYPRAN